MIASLFRRWRQEDTIEQLAAKCEALQQANARLAWERELLLDYALNADDCMWAVQDIADAWAEIAIQSAKDYNRVATELAALTGKATDADKAEPQEPVYYVVPESERPAKPKRTPRGKRTAVDDTASAG